MIKEAFLTKLDYVTFKDFTPFYIAENEDLTLCFTAQYHDLSNAYIQLKNGKILENHSLKKGTITIPKDSPLLIEGRLEIVVQIPHTKAWYLDGIKIKRLEESNILELSSLRDSYEASLQALEIRVEKLEKDKVNIFNI